MLTEEKLNTPEEDSTEEAEVVAPLTLSQKALELESLPLGERLEYWSNLEQDERMEVLVNMRGDAIDWLLGQLEESVIEDLFAQVDAEDLIDLIDHLPENVIATTLEKMSRVQKAHFETAQTYTTEEIGHWVKFDALMASPTLRVKDVFRLLKNNLPSYLEHLFLVNKYGLYVGAIRLSDLFLVDSMTRLKEINQEDFNSIPASDDPYDASKMLLDSGYSALPVVNDEGKYVGRIDTGAAYAFLKEEFEYQQMSSAGLDEGTDLFSPIIKSAKQRALWLAVNLLTAFLAAAFIGIFEATLQQVVALAVLMPIVASMGGIAGSQSLTLIIRGLALNQISTKNLSALLFKELGVAAINGIIWALIIGVIVFAWFQNLILGGVIAAAIFVNLLCAAFFGVITPIVLDRFKLDPALSGSVLLTTFTDVIGFVVFLGLGTAFLI